MNHPNSCPLEVPLPGGLVMRGARFGDGAEAADRVPVVCLPGLTRNWRDFEGPAGAIAAAGRPVFALSFRGRWPSDDDPEFRNYRPETYRDDVLAALDALGIGRAAFLGTSLGGIVTMLLAEAAPARLAGAIVNDIGPALAPEGIERIVGYVGGPPPGPAADLAAAAARMRAINEVAFPGRSDAFWDGMARRAYIPDADGGWRLAYDPGIGRALTEIGAAPDLWGGWRALAAVPTLLVRGALSDLLTPPIVADMEAARPGFDFVEVPDVGHAPMLDEPAAAAAIARFLDRIDGTA